MNLYRKQLVLHRQALELWLDQNQKHIRFLEDQIHNLKAQADVVSEEIEVTSEAIANETEE